jgi:hypothetical protein
MLHAFLSFSGIILTKKWNLSYPTQGTLQMTVSLSEILSESLEAAFGGPVFVFRKMLGPKTGEVARGWSKLNNEELQDLYCLPSSTGV